VIVLTRQRGAHRGTVAMVNGEIAKLEELEEIERPTAREESCAMVSSRLTDLRGKAAMVTGARLPDLITMEVAGSCLADRAPSVDV
jgi:hypothetical protein